MAEQNKFARMREEKAIGKTVLARKGEKVMIVRDGDDVCIVEHITTKVRFSVNKSIIEYEKAND